VESGVTTTVFHYDFNGNIIGESDLDGNFMKEYLYRGSSRLALVDIATEGIYFYGNDRLGTPQILTVATNTVVWEGYYKPFGEAEVNPNSSVVNNFRFPGQYYDQETGLHYNYHRYYDPKAGRYLRPDPSHSIQPRGNGIPCYLPLLFTTPQELNLYSHALNNTINRTDPIGLYVGAVGLGASGAISGLVSPGLFGSASILYVNDDKGNHGLVVCAGGGIAAGAGIVGGIQTSHLWGVDSVCDLEGGGFSLAFGAGGGAGPGAAADVGPVGLNVITGAGLGGYSGALNVIGGCKLIYSKYDCDDKCEDK